MSSSKKLAGEFQNSIAVPLASDPIVTDPIVADSIVSDPVIADALKHFNASVDAWSEAEYRRTRLNEPRLNEPKSTVRTVHHTWRIAASWALGCLLVSGSLAGGLFEHRQRQEAARAAEIKAEAQKAAQKVDLTRAAAAERNLSPAPVAINIAARRQPAAVKPAIDSDEDLLATVDNDVSRQVPAAMEPLAQMMDGSGSN
jgi:hypothetical protein